MRDNKKQASNVLILKNNNMGVYIAYVPDIQMNFY